MQVPRVDVLIPAFNAERTVVNAVRSILAQTITELRVIVVDDGSTDRTAALLAEMAVHDDRLMILTTGNQGIVRALNHGLTFTTAAFVARHDADDLAFPERLERQLEFMRSHPECVAVGANAHHIDIAGRRIGYLTRFTEDVVNDPYNSPSIEPYLLHPFLMARRQALIDAGGYRFVFHSEDTDLYWRLSRYGKLMNVVEPLGEYRIHAASISSKSIVNGRIAAIQSQLAALSERRRRDGVDDLTFPPHAIDRYQEAVELAPMMRVASQALSIDEQRYLATAVATKLLELSDYRPYRMSALDVTTIRHILTRHYFSLRRSNRLYVVLMLVLGRRRLRRDWFEAFRLVPWQRLPNVAWDALIFLPVRAFSSKSRP